MKFRKKKFLMPDTKYNSDRVTLIKIIKHKNKKISRDIKKKHFNIIMSYVQFCIVKLTCY